MKDRWMRNTETDSQPLGWRPQYSIVVKLGTLEQDYLGVSPLPLTNSGTTDNLFTILKALASSVYNTKTYAGVCQKYKYPVYVRFYLLLIRQFNKIWQLVNQVEIDKEKRYSNFLLVYT